MVKRGSGKKLTLWQQSAEFRQIGREAITKWNKVDRPKQPKCTAMAKSSGEKCRQLAMPNGKCRYHGGATGSGSAWHVPQWPDRSSVDAEAKLHGKLKALDKAAKGRATRLAKMTPEERKQHELWQRTHKPGPATARQRAKRERRENAAFAASLAQSPPPPTNEAKRLLDEIESLEALLEQRASKREETIFD